MGSILDGRDFSLPHSNETGSGAHSASYPTSTRGSFFWVKPPGREADYPSMSSVEVKNARSYIFTPLYVLMVWCVIKQGRNLSLICGRLYIAAAYGDISTQYAIYNPKKPPQYNYSYQKFIVLQAVPCSIHGDNIRHKN
jgi:hypothetical protein